MPGTEMKKKLLDLKGWGMGCQVGVKHYKVPYRSIETKYSELIAPRTDCSNSTQIPDKNFLEGAFSHQRYFSGGPIYTTF